VDAVARGEDHLHAVTRRSTLVLSAAPRSRALGLLVAVAAVVATTLVIYPLRAVVPPISTGVLYLVAVLLLSTYWGLWLGLVSAVASALAFNFFHIPPTGRFTIAEPENWVALAVYLVAAAIASTVADLARSRAAEAERRREEADLAAEMAQILLGGASLQDALTAASRRLGESLGLPGTALTLGATDGADGRPAIPLDLGGARRGALVVAGAVEESVVTRLRDRVVPSLEALLRAALDRDALQAEVVETAALRRSDVMKTALLRAVSHDLRSPLTAIIAAAEAVRSPDLSAAERDELGALVVDEAGRLSRLVEQLLDLSKLQGGAAEPRRDWCSIEEVIRSAIEQLGTHDGAAPIELSLDRELPLVQADPAQLERVFVNLLENARRYSGGHPVKVRARAMGGRLKVRVIDRGPGLSADELQRIFEPFYRRQGGPGHQGAGLGLAIVKGFVEANGGRVQAESLPGQGAVFAIDFPLEQPAEVPVQPGGR
jgi:two-component system sensor histidine kinase KdpD